MECVNKYVKMSRIPYIQKDMEKNPEKYPKRYGMPWDEDETQQLLIEIARKKSYEEIAETHERTLGGILACLKRIVCQYHDEGKSIEKIMKYTGFSEKRIEKIIKKESNKQTPIVKTLEMVQKESTIENDDICLRLEQIENLLVKILDKLESL